MTLKLFFNAITKFLFGTVLVGLLIFLPAGSFSFTYGWIFMGILFIPILIAGIVLMFRNPGLLKKDLMRKKNKRNRILFLSSVL